MLAIYSFTFMAAFYALQRYDGRTRL